MIVVKPHSSIQKEFFWDSRVIGLHDIHGDGEKITLLFGIFYIDKFASKDQDQLQDVLRKTQEHFRLWNEHYPWSEYNGISFSLEEMENGTQFIYGQICVENNVVEEEFLVLTLLVQLSTELGPHVFVRVRDTEGSFILEESVHDELDHNKCDYQYWLNCGRFKYIPNEDLEDGKKSPLEVIEYLKDYCFRCVDASTLNNFICNKLANHFPGNVLSKLVKLPIEIEEKDKLSLLSENPRMITYLLKNVDEEVISQVPPSQEGERIELLVSQDTCTLIPFILEMRGLNKDPNMLPLLCGRAVSAVLDTLIKRKTLTVLPNEASAKTSPKGTIFDLRNFKSASIDPSLTKDPKFDLSGELLKGFDQILRKGFEFDADISDEDENDTDDLDDECRRYFQAEDVDIDEDDFFEFFLKEGLQLSNVKVEELRRVEDDGPGPSK